MKDIELVLTLDEVNVLIEALGKEPFIKVYKIMEKLHLQTSSQMQQPNTDRDN